MARVSHRTCHGCGGLMELLSSARSRILLFWCPFCHRIAEQYQPSPRGGRASAASRGRRAPAERRRRDRPVAAGRLWRGNGGGGYTTEAGRSSSVVEQSLRKRWVGGSNPPFGSLRSKTPKRLL